MKKLLYRWKSMFEPSSIRKEFEELLLSRSDVTVRAWGPLVDAEFAEKIVNLIETCSEFPRQKIIPDDRLAAAFHGRFDSDLPFGRFSCQVHTLYGMKITIAFVQSVLDIERATIRDFVQVLFNHYRQNSDVHH